MTVAVTLPLSEKLDEIDPISRSYIFEVSSRDMKDLSKLQGL